MRAGYPQAHSLHTVAVGQYRKIRLYPRREYRICTLAPETALWDHWGVLTAFQGWPDVLYVSAAVLQKVHNV